MDRVVVFFCVVMVGVGVCVGVVWVKGVNWVIICLLIDIVFVESFWCCFNFLIYKRNWL